MRFMQTVRLFCLFPALLLPAFSGALAGEEKPAGGKAASVNGVVITEEDVNRQMFVLEQHLMSTQGTAIRPDMIPVLRQKMLDELIEQELLYQESQRQGLEVDDDAVNDEIGELKKKFPNDEEAFLDGMGQMNLSEESLKLQMKKNLSVKNLVEKEVLAKVRFLKRIPGPFMTAIRIISKKMKR
jgi:parvulin-like peptidyl-prolyl isomerase